MRTILKKLGGFATGLFTLFIFLYISNTSFIKEIEEKSLDLRFKTEGSRNINSDLVLVEIDEVTVQKFNWPVRRIFQANILDKLIKSGATVVGYDILFLNQDLENAEYDNIFGEVIKTHGKVILGVEPRNLYSWSKITPLTQETSKLLPTINSVNNPPLKNFPVRDELGVPIEPLLNNTKSLASLEIKRDINSFYKYIYPFTYIQNNWIPNLGLAIFLEYKNISASKVKITSDNKLIIQVKDEPDRIVNMDKEYKTLINFRSGYNNVERISFIKLLNLEQKKLENMFNNKAVIIGQTLKSVGDWGSTALENNAPIVLAHMNFFNSLIKNDLKTTASKNINLLVMIIIFLIISFSLSYLSTVKGLFVTVFVTSVFIFVNQMLFNNGYVLYFSTPIIMVIFIFINISIYNHFVRDVDKKLVEQALSSYVSPGVLSRIISNPERLNTFVLTKEISILFSDIKGYTTLSNSLPPNEIMNLLKEYLNVMTTIILQYDGTIDKIMGDGIMAFFGDPADYDDYAVRAVRTAVDMQKALLELVKKWEKEGKKGIEIRVGIATGEVFVGNIGSKKHLEYTAIGTAVNLASRLESNGPPGGILICKDTYKEVKDLFNCEIFNGLKLKGYKDLYYPYKVINKK